MKSLTLHFPFIILLLFITVGLSAIIAPAAGAARGHGVYPMIETSFTLAAVPGNPFDENQVDVQVEIRRPRGGAVRIPAFFDGGTTWRMRFTPDRTGRYTIASITLNGRPAPAENLTPKEWKVEGNPLPGFVRIRGDRFAFDDGTPYFPLGHNQAWRTNNLPDIPELFGKMHAAGENWSRVWMNAWDNKNLSWPVGVPAPKLGELDLNVAHRWDSIVSAAAANNIYFQMTLQHHGQYSSTTDPNWNDNPYNVKNGGFLQDPANFFTDTQARTLTRHKLRYIVARWGYSPNILAFELFNEVQFTDAAHAGRWQDIAAWHDEMAQFIRQQDPYHHLITTSSTPDVPAAVWSQIDYIQKHTYPSDLLIALSSPSVGPGEDSRKPGFVGEFGPQNLNDKDGIYLHIGLWASLMTGLAGAAQYWSWDTVEQNNLYSHFVAAQRFVTATGLEEKSDRVQVVPLVDSPQRADLRFGPGGGFSNRPQDDFTVEPTGPPAGIQKLPAFLQGANHRAMNPQPLVFHVNYVQPGSFIVHLARIARAGAHLKITMDTNTIERDFAAGPNDYAPPAETGSIEVTAPAGPHTITVENTAKDWVQVRDFTFTNYTSALGALGLVGRQSAAVWVYHRANVDAAVGKETDAASGKLIISGLKRGHYRATWWDTRAGEPIKTDRLLVDSSAAPASLDTPPILRDAAVYLVKIPG